MKTDSLMLCACARVVCVNSTLGWKTRGQQRVVEGEKVANGRTEPESFNRNM